MSRLFIASGGNDEENSPITDLVRVNDETTARLLHEYAMNCWDRIPAADRERDQINEWLRSQIERLHVRLLDADDPA